MSKFLYSTYNAKIFINFFVTRTVSTYFPCCKENTNYSLKTEFFSQVTPYYEI